MTTPRPGSDDSPTSVDRFFDQFDIAFGSFDGALIAQRYGEPYVACRADGTSEVFGTNEETARYFQGVLDDYFSMGVRSCRHRDVDVVEVGARHRVGTVTWELVDESANVVTSWRESYVLVDDIDGLLVRSSIDH